MKKSHLFISILIFLISLAACKSSVKESDTVVSPDGNVLRDITDPEDTINHNWVYDVNDGMYRMEHTTGAGSGQIVITDRKGRLCAAYGYNQCQPQIAKVCYKDDRPSKLILIWEDDKVDLMPDGTYLYTSWIGDAEWNDVGKMFDKLMKGEVNVEILDSVVINYLTYDNTGHVIEVRNPVSGKCMEALGGCCIISEIEETDALAGVLDFNFRITNTIRPVEK